MTEGNVCKSKPRWVVLFICTELLSPQWLVAKAFCSQLYPFLLQEADSCTGGFLQSTFYKTEVLELIGKGFSFVSSSLSELTELTFAMRIFQALKSRRTVWAEVNCVIFSEMLKHDALALSGLSWVFGSVICHSWQKPKKYLTSPKQVVSSGQVLYILGWHFRH